MDHKIAVFGIVVLLLLMHGATAQAQEEGALAGIEGALGDIDIEALIPDAIGGILGGPIVAIMVNCISSLCVTPLIYFCMGCPFCGIGGLFCCVYMLIFNIISLPITLLQTLLCGYCPCNWPLNAIAAVAYSICSDIAGAPLAERLMPMIENLMN